MEVTKENIEKIINGINDGKYLKTVQEEYGFSKSYINSCIKALKYADSPFYNLEMYNKLKNKIKENQYREIKRVKPKPKHNLSDMEKKFNSALQLIMDKNIGIEEAANEYIISVDKLMEFIKAKEVNDEEKEKINTRIHEYTEKNKKIKIHLKDYPLEVRKEIFLMALTYRTSYETLAKIIHTSTNDIVLTFANDFFEWHECIYSLNLETKNEDEIQKKVSEVNAKNYWLKRNALIKKLNLASTKEEKEKYKEELKEHRKCIDDTYAYQLIGKDYRALTEEDKDCIARHCLKYYLSNRKGGILFKMNRETIKVYEENLAAKDLVYAEKLRQKKDVYREYNIEIARQYGIPKEEKRVI